MKLNKKKDIMKLEEFFSGNNPSREDIKRITDYIHSIKNENRRRNAYSCAENILRDVRLGGYRHLREILLPNDNTLSMKIFEILIGVKLHRTQKKRLQQLEDLFQEEHASYLSELEKAKHKRLREAIDTGRKQVWYELLYNRIRLDDGRVVSRLQNFWELRCKGWKVKRQRRGAVNRHVYISPDGNEYIFIDARTADYLQSVAFILDQHEIRS
jgi:hypothetical protein